MTRWEYMTTECASLAELNHYGADGWEFIGEVRVMVPDEDEGQETSRRLMLFKRPSQEQT